MLTLSDSIADWLRDAQAKAANGGVTAADLQQLQRLTKQAIPRQRLLYLHARTPSISAPVIGMAQHEPTTGGSDTLQSRGAWPYETVHEAVVDGWQIVQFPNPMAPYDDRELNYVGYEFVLQKLEEMVEENHSEKNNEESKEESTHE